MDTRTLFQISAIITGVVFAYLVLIHISTPILSGLRSVCYAFGCAATGLWLASLRGHAPDLISVVLGTAFILLVNVFLYHSLVQLFRLRRHIFWLAFFSVVPALAWNTWFALIHPSPNQRILAYSLVLCFQNALLALLVLRNGSPHTRIPRMNMGSLFLFWAAVNLFRFGRDLILPEPSSFPAAHPIRAMIVLIPMLASLITVITFLWLAAAKLHYSLELRDRTDALTGLPDRRGLEVTATREIARARHARTPLSAVLFHLDHIETLTDRFGQNARDFALHITAACLTESLRGIDLVARVGRGEFVLFLPETPAADASGLAHRLRDLIQQLQMRHDNREFYVEVSIGVTELQEDDLTWQDMLRRAEHSLHDAQLESLVQPLPA